MIQPTSAYQPRRPRAAYLRFDPLGIRAGMVGLASNRTLRLCALGLRYGLAHAIEPGEPARTEGAWSSGTWRAHYMCLRCLDAWLDLHAQPGGLQALQRPLVLFHTSGAVDFLNANGDRRFTTVRCEVGEVEQLPPADVQSIKQFISRSADRFSTAYAPAQDRTEGGKQCR